MNTLFHSIESHLKHHYQEVLATYAGEWDLKRIDGACQLELLDGTTRTDAHFVVRDGQFVFAPGRHEQPTTTVRMAADALLRFVAGDGVLDFTKVQATGNFAMLEPLVLQRALPEDVRRLEAAESISAAHPVHDVLTVERPDVHSVLDSLIQSRPLRARGMLAAHPLLRCDFDTLLRELGDVELGIGGKGWSTLAQLVRAMRNGDDAAYTKGTYAPDALKAMVDAPFFARGAFNPAQVWMGAAGGSTPNTTLHRDLFDGLLVQLIGCKRVVFFSPDQAERLYPFRHFRGHQRCWVEPWAPDLARHPKFGEARAIELVLEPGEILVIPAGWFHYVHALDETLSVSFSAKHGALYPDRARAGAPSH